MNTIQHINIASFTLENNKWIEDYNKRAINQDIITKHHLETKYNSGSKTLKKLHRILLQNL